MPSKPAAITPRVSATAGCRIRAIPVAAVLWGALIGWSCGGDGGSGGPTFSAGTGGIVGSSAGGGGSFEDVGPPPVATLCGDPVCPPLPGEDASTDDMEAGLPVVDGGSEASADGSMADGAGSREDASTDGSRDSGGDGGSPDSEAAGDWDRSANVAPGHTHASPRGDYSTQNEYVALSVTEAVSATM
jgi:hypothetical protein